MRKIKYNIILCIILALLPNACELQTDWKTGTLGGFLVMDCIITNEFKFHELRLLQSVHQLNELPEGIAGATIKLSNGTTEISFYDYIPEPGRYVSAVPFAASAGNLYRLTISYGNISDTAYAVMTGITPLDSISIIPYGNLFRVNYIESNQPSMTEIYYDWTSDTAYSSKYGSNTASEVFYSLDNIDIGKLFPSEKETIAFPHNTKIIRRKYSLSEEHQQFLRSLLLETEWRGGLFDVEQGNVPTNFRDGVRGWFAACMVLSDTTDFQ
jgi:hypothetical protein